MRKILKNTSASGVHDFFEGYARAMEQHDSKYIAGCYSLPCTFISDDESRSYTTTARLEGLINQSKRFYTIHGITSVTAEVMNTYMITQRIARVTLRWIYKNDKGLLVYDCNYLYILRLDAHQHWRIETAIDVNEKERIAALN